MKKWPRVSISQSERAGVVLDVGPRSSEISHSPKHAERVGHVDLSRRVRALGRRRCSKSRMRGFRMYAGTTPTATRPAQHRVQRSADRENWNSLSSPPWVGTSKTSVFQARSALGRHLRRARCTDPTLEETEGRVQLQVVLEVGAQHPEREPVRGRVRQAQPDEGWSVHAPEPPHLPREIGRVEPVRDLEEPGSRRQRRPRSAGSPRARSGRRPARRPGAGAARSSAAPTHAMPRDVIYWTLTVPVMPECSVHSYV